MSNNSNKLGLDDLLMKLDYRLTPQGTWCRKYSIFAERMAQLTHPKWDRSKVIEFDEVYINGLVSDYEHKMDTCKNLSEHIGDRLATRCVVCLKIKDGTVFRSLHSKEQTLFEDQIPYKEFYDLAFGEFFYYPEITPRSKWGSPKYVLIGFILLCILLSFLN